MNFVKLLIDSFWLIFNVVRNGSIDIVGWITDVELLCCDDAMDLLFVGH